jgi:ribosome production factor 1
VQRQKEELLALERGEEPKPRQIPKTIENQRVKDETFIVKEDEDEIKNEDAEDEFASYFSLESEPKIIITTSRKPSGDMFKFLENLFTVIPNAYYYARRSYHVKEMVKYATTRGFTDLLIFNENKTFSKGSKVNGLLHVHLPEGPSVMYKLSNLILSKKIRNHGRATSHFPELLLNNFSTRMGHRIGRMFASLFPQKPEFKGRRVVTFHNQRDFIFFRHHRYVFEEKKGVRRKHAGHLATAEVNEDSFSKNKLNKNKKKKSKALPKSNGDEDDGDEDVQFSGDEASDSDSDEYKVGSSSSDDDSDSDGSEDSEGDDSDSEGEEDDDSDDDDDNESSSSGDLDNEEKKEKAKKKERPVKLTKAEKKKIAEENDDRPTSIIARLQELGPRFTLKLMSVQKGTFDSKHGEFEYVRSTETDGTRKNRRKFIL